MDLDRAGLADFLRTRRGALQPEDVGLPRGQRRRTEGLRREEVAALAHMSVDYVARLEREVGPQPSPQMLASIAQGLHLSRIERDHLFRLAGHEPPATGVEGEHVAPGLLRVLDRLDDTPAEIVTELGETLRQTRMAVALLGDLAALRGPERSIGYRWFMTPGARDLHPADDHPFYSRMYASGLRELTARRGPGSRAAAYASLLLERSEEFRAVWERHEVGVRPRETKRFVHAEVGELDLACQQLVDPAASHTLLVYTAIPGTPSHERLALLQVLADAGAAAG